MDDFIDFKGKKLVVIGASRGIGATVASLLGRYGAKCALVARNEENLKRVSDAMDGEGHKYYVADMSDLGSIEGVFESIMSDFGGAIDGLVYSAGITDDRPFNMDTPEFVDKILNVNLKGFLECVRCGTKKNRYNSGMRIVGISSVASRFGRRGGSLYCASKAGMDGAVRSLAVELSTKGICINTVAPALIHTQMYEATELNNGHEKMEKRLERQYLGLGEPEDVANAVIFLLSNRARFITGVCLPVDGGYMSN